MTAFNFHVIGPDQKVCISICLVQLMFWAGLCCSSIRYSVVLLTKRSKHPMTNSSFFWGQV
jgi:hypothetical protein